jgi:HD-like signal output (HDOD) protein/anti-anti-sigma regulatory factor
MATVFIMVENSRERQVLKIICESFGYDVLELPVRGESLPQLIQYSPESLIIEIDKNSNQQSNFIKQVRSQSKIKGVRILTFGDSDDPEIVDKFTEYGKTTYFRRPLKTANIKQVLRTKESSDSSLRREYKETYKGELDDTAMIMDSDTPPSKRIELMVAKIGELLAFPFTIAKVLSVTQSSTTGANDLAKAIEIDPVVVSSILKVSNSALYGRAGTSITTIKDAIVRIGFIETKNIAISLSVMMLFSDEENSIGFDRKEFWYHSLSVAVIAGKMAEKAGYKQPEIPFVCGLLHDFGIILLDEFFPTFLFSTLRSATQKGVPFVQEQKERWGITHNDVVCKLFEQWNMPEEILLPLKEWNRGLDYTHPINPQMSMLVHVVRSADIMAKALELGRECDEYVIPISPERFKEFKIVEPVGDHFFNLINRDINMFSTYLQMEHTPFVFNRDITKHDRVATINFIDFSNSYFNSIEFYLITQNIQFQYKTEIDEIVESQTPAEMIIIFCDKNTTLEMVTPYSEVVIRTEESLTLDPIPLLLIGDESLKQHFESLPDNCGFIADKIDLRVVTFSIQRLLLGHPLEHSFETEKNEKKEIPTVSSKPAITTRIIGKMTIVLSLNGDIGVSSMKELKQLLSTLLTKTKSIVLNFKDIVNCDENLLLLLEEFRKIVRTKGVVLVLCSLGGEPACCKNSAKSELLFVFDTDEELLAYINPMLK